GPGLRIESNFEYHNIVYQIVVIRSGSYDCERVAIERRYSDFLHLHQELLLDFSEEMEDIVMPRKKMRGNFSEENIGERRVALRDYLTQLYSLRFELKAAYDLLRGGRFSRALEVVNYNHYLIKPLIQNFKLQLFCVIGLMILT
uniref:Sorting nexin 20 n=1 Tax=Sinocyclocheilus rhinocerous TaxID=307959 RepID=A0A673H9B1_9TELE